MRYAICYVSTVNPALSETEIQKALEFSKNWNNDNGITGILLYSEGNFFQVLEGGEQLLKDLFCRIKADERHNNIIPIFQKQIPGTKFETYEADFISLDDRYKDEHFDIYFAHISLLDPSIQSSVKYILNNFTEGIN
ncbi:BLUF domain-containing protein [Salegentibacter sp. JZCK2]|uniref:BLUF domain-containing protein n=1 Tax=Salegentibacter tibetensis TaxID=2873600 RepID=UPI001CC94BA2|nr:BLUF domain-containing protein [Salegentibacter tibetensis]MBZ9728396.1 BLUF domain-containing protein [Salegentibacter tibetensis]